MITLHNVSNFYTNRSSRSVLKMKFVNIKYINMRRYLDPFLGYTEYLKKWS